MNEPFSFGAPERRLFAVQFGYDVRPSFWQNVQSNAHLVIAAVGTVALLGVAGVALWLALPGSDRQAMASAAQAVPAIPVKTTKVAPAAANVAVTVAAAPQAARKADAVSPATVSRDADIPALASNSPRWTGPSTETASVPAETAPASSDQAAKQPPEPKEAAAAFAETDAKSDASKALSQVAAPEPADNKPADDQATDDQPAADDTDSARTAAIPQSKPQVAAAEAAASESEDPATPDASAAESGRIVKAVTMRTGPKKGAAAIVTIPAKTSVQVVNCKKWCEIVYNGKRGWVYKTYVKTGA
ncbi:SH3 domain-containing protein [Mesorhizobium sp. WSM3876]|uniref:SH3 domain-containing protein n=1 Tax=Mesorhizobium sp. WSM3876 TaxID=422277 RepID=UPI000BB0B935|nr:SH3 domain-containing protein [Mesorhizobium sp. WSM3876]PBB83648.1 peptide-binding protein [Mesorhizobium sp. WSM3876]